MLREHADTSDVSSPAEASSPVVCLLQVMTFDAEQLKENLTYRERAVPGIASADVFDSFPEAEKIIQDLWPGHELKKSGPVQNEAAGEQEVKQ